MGAIKMEAKPTLQTQFLELPGGRLAYDDNGGPGPLVVCAPGLGDLRGQYRFVAAALREKGYRVVTVDLRGQGDSSARWPEYTSEAVGADLVALLKHLNAKKATLVGNSMSAASAVWAAAELPDVVEKLVMIGPFVRDIPTSTFTRWLLGAAFVRPWGPRAWGLYYNSLYPSRKPSDFDSYRETLLTNLRASGRMEAVNGYIRASKHACEVRLPNVRARSLVVMGERDPDFDDPAAEARTVVGLLPERAELLLVPDAGHYPHAEWPERVLPELERFLQEAP